MRPCCHVACGLSITQLVQQLVRGVLPASSPVSNLLNLRLMLLPASAIQAVTSCKLFDCLTVSGYFIVLANARPTLCFVRFCPPGVDADGCSAAQTHGRCRAAFLPGPRNQPAILLCGRPLRRYAAGFRPTGTLLTSEFQADLCKQTYRRP